jgi:Fe2+ or Zn2+ uptake regulation protein
MQAYTTLLRKHELKATTPRMAILEAIDHVGHSSIEEMYGRICQKYPAVSLGTLYKNVECMSEKGLLTPIAITGEKQKYEITKAPHIHLICTACLNVMDIAYMPVREFKQQAEENGFLLQHESISLYGLCPVCRQTHTKEKE